MCLKEVSNVAPVRALTEPVPSVSVFVMTLDSFVITWHYCTLLETLPLKKADKGLCGKYPRLPLYRCSSVLVVTDKILIHLR